MKRTGVSQRGEDRTIDQALSRWVRERSGSELVARAAFAVSVAEGRGDACTALADADFCAADIAELRGHGWIGDGGARPTPFVLDEHVHLYTWRNWQNEVCLAQAIQARALARTLPVAAAELAADLAALFGDEPAEATRWQRIAVAAAPGARVFVMSGGPGTGKTTTALRLLLMLLRHATACGIPESATVALAAPTGKAAQRLGQAIARGKQYLRARLPADCAFHGLLERIAHTEAATLHRLLGYRPWDDAFTRGVDNLLPADIVLVDEASMVDLAMMRRLFESLRPQATLILLGDPRQLAAVEAGSVLDDIVASVAQNALPVALSQRLPEVAQASTGVATHWPALTGQVITLTHGWRAGSGLARGVGALRAGDLGWLEDFLAAGADGGLRLHRCTDSAQLRVRIDAWIDIHAALFGQLLKPGIAPAAALESLRGAQVLCALRDGPFGVHGINPLIGRRLGERFGFDAKQTWHHGRPVIVTRNDYARDLFNGDTGVVLHGAEGPRVWFETSARDGTSQLRSLSPRALPAHETAWAITIHRSQGSEYADVAVVLPPDPDNRVLSRELLYTAVSRATRSAEIWSTPEAVRGAALRPIARLGGLRQRLG